MVMRQQFLWILCLACLPLGGCGSEEGEINQVFQGYRSALMRGDGKAAWDMVDSHTKDLYEGFLRDAISLPRRDLDRLQPLQKLSVLRLRQEFRKAELERSTGQDIFSAAVSKGWLGSEYRNITSFERVVIKGSAAHAYIPGSPGIPAFKFLREGNTWKLSLWLVMDQANEHVRQLQAQSGLSEREFLLRILGGVSKYRVDERIFDGPIN